MNALIFKIQHSWETRLEEWERLRVHVDGAAIASEVLADLTRLSEGDGHDELTLKGAAAISGYSADHLSRLIRAGSLPNVGKKGAPRIRRADLPIRPKRDIATARNTGYDPIADARSLGVRR